MCVSERELFITYFNVSQNSNLYNDILSWADLAVVQCLNMSSLAIHVYMEPDYDTKQ